MYEERRDSFSIRDIILQVLFVALFVFILLWLFPTKNYITNYSKGAIEEAVNNALSDYEFGGGINSEAFANQLFNQNVMMMKSAAKDYFTLSRLPQNNGDQVKITLKQMLDEKMILPFIDSNGKSCDVDASYVQVTKTDTEYLMKVNLKCSDYEDYLLVHMGCYDYCSTTICENKTTTTPSKGGDVTPQQPSQPQEPTPVVYEYEYQLVVDGKWGEFGEWSEWTQNIVSKTEYNEVETKTEKVFEKYEDIIDGTTTETVSASETVTYSCPDNSYTLNGDKCVKTSDITESIPAIETKNYTCPSGYTKEGTRCYKYYNDSHTMPAVVNTTYYCPDSSYTLSGDRCYKNITIPATATYSCPSGYNQNGSTCYKESEEIMSATATYTCPSGYTRSGSTCYKETSETVTVSTVYTCPSGYTKNGSACYKTETISANKSTSYTDWVYSYQKTSSTPLTDKTTEKYVVAGVKVNSSCKSPCTNMYTYTYDVYTRSPKTTYTCPSGYTKNGTTCSKTVVISGNKSYTCPSGYTKNGTTCSKSVKTTKAATVSYSCPSGYSKMGDACVKRGSTTKAATVSYSCPSGYSQSGSTCYMSNSIAATPRISSYCSESGYGLIDEYTCVKTSQNADIIEATVNTTYSCPNNTYTLSGKNCYKTKTNSETKPATENKTYSCPEGYKQNNNMCEKTVTKYKRVEIYKDVTYYRSRVREYIAGSIDYKWSRSQNDISLIKKGYVLTGKSRVVE